MTEAYISVNGQSIPPMSERNTIFELPDLVKITHTDSHFSALRVKTPNHFELIEPGEQNTVITDKGVKVEITHNPFSHDELIELYNSRRNNNR